MKHAVLLAMVLLLAPLFGSCQLLGESAPDPDWIEREVSAPSENVVWQVVRRSLEVRHFPIGGGLDPDRLVAESGWLRSLAPFKGRGYQIRAVVEIVPLGADRYNIRIHVQRQNNDALVNPADARYAEWKWVADDKVEAKILMGHIRTYLDNQMELGS